MIIIIRGLPGSGKSYLAKYLAKTYNCVICSTDNFFMKNGQYIFEPSKLGHYHKTNQLNVEELIFDNKNVVVDNTNITWKEMKPYIEIASSYNEELHFYQPENEWSFNVDECFNRNTHGVPNDAIQRMFDRFQGQDVIENLMKEHYPNIVFNYHRLAL